MDKKFINIPCLCTYACIYNIVKKLFVTFLYFILSAFISFCTINFANIILRHNIILKRKENKNSGEHSWKQENVY